MRWSGKVQSIVKFIVSVCVWAYFKYLCKKEQKELKDRMEEIKNDKAIKEAIQRGDRKEVARIIKYYREYANKSTKTE